MQTNLDTMTEALVRYKFLKLNKVHKKVFVICTDLDVPFAMNVSQFYRGLIKKVQDTLNPETFYVTEGAEY